MHRFIWLGVFAFLLSPLIAWSHEASAIVPGSRIRITEQVWEEVPSGRWQVNLWLALSVGL